MGYIRCDICLARVPTWRQLVSHLVSGHSKWKLAGCLVKSTVFNLIPKYFARKLKRTRKNSTQPEVHPKAETVFANDTVEILCRDNDIIIRDDKSSVDMEFSFDECSSNESKDSSNGAAGIKKRLRKPVKQSNNNNKSSCLKRFLNLQTSEIGCKWNVNTSSSSASSEDSTKRFSFKKKIRKKRDTRDKTRHYKINITRTKNCEHLDENTGKFYMCECVDKTDKKTLKNTTLKLASDTESASDTGRPISFHDLKVFCSKCGNGYRDENLLLEHMKIHETHCRVCNEIFPTESLFKEHIETHIFKVFACHICGYEFPAKPMLNKHFQLHLDHSIIETVIDMEEEYKWTPSRPFLNMKYQSSITNILHYLTDKQDLHCSDTKVPKVYCDICLTEVFVNEYECHKQLVHHVYGSN